MPTEKSIVIALYINGDKVASMYSRPEALWLICPVMLYWIGRIWMITSRGQMNEDPVVFAIRDRVTWLLGCICLVIISFAMALNWLANSG